MEGLVNSFWSGKKVLVTGHTGFKGSWLCLWLQTLGAQVTGYALHPPSTPNLFEAARVSSGIHSIHGDVRHHGELLKAFQQSQPEIVFHLAAQSLVRLSYQNPIETFETNIMGTAHVLECVRHTPSVRSAVIVTSDKCYENKQWNWPYREIDALGGHDPYSASKACAELVSSSFQSSFFASTPDGQKPFVATARAGNVIGGGDWAQDRLLPDLVRSFTSGDHLRVRHPHALRPWQHVLEPLRGYLVLAQALFEQHPYSTGAWNFGPSAEAVQPVQWIVEWLRNAWGGSAAWSVDPSPHPHEAGILTLDSSKAAAQLGWRPCLDLQAALRLTFTWYRRFLDGTDARHLCIEQIESYTSLVKEI
jgi:CDP-glucose 4,6-dehydratase